MGEDPRGGWHDWPFEPLAILRALERGEVRYVVIGGFAAVVHGYPLPTYDLDITPAADDQNLERLLAVIDDLGGEPVGVDRTIDTESPEALDLLRREGEASFRTSAGFLDVFLRPSGTGGYRDLHRYATDERVAKDLVANVASLLDVIRSKEAAHREKDIAQLPALRATLELSHEVHAGAKRGSTRLRAPASR